MTPNYNGNPIEILTIRPDEKADVVLSTVGKTILKEALDTSEERWQQYPRSLIGLAYDATTCSAWETAYIRKQLETAQDKFFGVPIWPHKSMLSEAADAGSTFLIVDSMDGLLFTICDYVLIWSDFDTWEVVRCFQPAFATRLDLQEATALDWSAGAANAPVFVMPLFIGNLARPKAEALTDEHAKISFSFLETWNLVASPVKHEKPLVPLTPVVTLSGCLDTITIDFGGTIPELKRFLVETSADDGTTWDHYTYAKRSRTRLVLNNYFGGTKLIRVKLIMLDLTVVDTGIRISPPAPNVKPPTITVSGFNTPIFALPSNYIGKAGADNSNALVVADLEQLDYQGLPILKVPCGEAFIEATKKEYRLNSWGDPQTPSTMEVDLSCATGGATIKFTIDGTVPTVSVGLDSGTVISPYLVPFGCVLIARAFKDGCSSPPTYLLVDKAIEAQDLFETEVGAIAASSSCDLWNWQRQPNPTDPDSDCVPLPTHRSCWTLYGSNSPSGVLAAWQITLTASPSGPSTHLQLYQNDSSASVSGVTTDPGTCSSGSTWSDGTVTMVDTSQTVANFQTDAQTSHASDLDQFPNSITCMAVSIHSQDPDVTTVHQPWSDRCADDFFGPTRAVSGWTSSPINLYSGGTAAGTLKGLAIVISLTVNPAYSILLESLKMVCTLAPTNAPDIWNADDIAP